MRLLAPSVSFHALVAAVLAQTPPFPRPGEDPTGVVLDAHAQPIAGATVALMAETDPNAPFARAIGALLQRTPLPEVPAGTDGSFVLPLTAAQRALGAAGEGRFWLVVRKAGYHDWREPLPQGIAGYLGSRVIVRPARPDDPLAKVPWPPSPAALGTFRAMAMWWPTSAPPPGHDVDRRGPRASDQRADPASVGAATLRAHTLRVARAGGQPVAAASLLFGNSCLEHHGSSLPETTDEDGLAAVRLPDGDHDVRIAAAGFLPVVVKFTVGDLRPAQTPCTLTHAELADVLAVDGDDRPVPFVRLDLVPHDLHSGIDRSLAVLADSLGRARVPLSGRDAYFAYEDYGAPAERVDLAGRDAVHVRKRRPVTMLLRGVADLGPRGMVCWLREPSAVMRAFENQPTADDAVASFAFREDQEAWFGGMRQPPVVVRQEELAPAPASSLLPLVALDRRLRERARLTLRSSTGAKVGVVWIGPRWQLDHPPRDDVERYEFARRDDDGNWSLWARDDDAYDLVALASNHLPAPVALPAAEPGAPPLDLVVELQRK
jgi:hypothetical protein